MTGTSEEKAGKKAGRPIRVLIIEDQDDDCELVLHELRRGGFDPQHQRVETPEALRACLGGDRSPGANDSWDIIISDFQLPRFTGIDALKMIRGMDCELPFLLVSGTVGEEHAVAAMKSGANDYLMKGNLTRLVPAVERELRDAAFKRQLTESLRTSEESLRRSQKMEAVGRLAGGVAHDFNNILAVILLYAEAVLDDPDAGAKIVESTHAIRKAADKGADLIRKLLVFSKTQLSQPKLVSINDSLRELLDLLQKLATEQIEIRMDLDEELGKIEIDPVQLEQVVINLVANAKDAMPSGGIIELRTRKVGTHAVLEVSDTGTGMDTATMERIFEPFFTTKPEGKGTGLGLATVYGIVQKNGGSIEVFSELGKGSRFSLRFPISSRSEEAARSERAHARAAPRSARILLVEDDEALRRVMQATLERAGYEVLNAANGELALAAVADGGAEIDLLVTDAVMPGFSGVELSDRLAALRRDLKVLFVSGYSKDLVFSSFDDKRRGFLAKPFASADLLRKVQELLG